MATVRYIECSTVAELITGPMKDDVAVVDVRDEVSMGTRIDSSSRAAVSGQQHAFASMSRL
jgi:hypothetical protein